MGPEAKWNFCCRFGWVELAWLIEGIIMTIEDLFQNLPDEPVEVFTQIEQKLRENVIQALDRVSSEGSTANRLRLSYANSAIGAAKALGLKVFPDTWKIPITNGDSNNFNSVIASVDYYLMQEKIIGARRLKKYSVALSAGEKQKIRHHIEQIKDVIDGWDIPVRKKDAIIERTNALLNEVDKERTRFDAAMDFILEASTVAGQAAEKLKPLAELVTKIMGTAREKEQRQLSIGHEPVRLIEDKTEEDAAA